MDLSELLSPKKNDIPVIQPEVDPTKYTKIVMTLCEKRKALELALQNNTSTDTGEDALSLLQLKQAMSAFGVTEITYQAYLAKSNMIQEVSHEPATPQTLSRDASSSEDSFRD